MARQYGIDHLESLRVQGLQGHPELGRDQHGAMALLDSGQFHQQR
jgi:hypothetical protein